MQQCGIAVRPDANMIAQVRHTAVLPQREIRERLCVSACLFLCVSLLMSAVQELLRRQFIQNVVDQSTLFSDSKNALYCFSSTALAQMHEDEVDREVSLPHTCCVLSVDFFAYSTNSLSATGAPFA
jgi:hypothetical protein